MTTARSPLRLLKAQADKIAAVLKAAERGDRVEATFAEKIAAARGKESITFAIAMDDKVIKVEMPWALVKETNEVALGQWILNRMRESRETAH